MLLVTAPLPACVRHKVYDADYVGAVGSSDADLHTSTVVEATRAGTVLIGSSRERIGFDDTVRVEVLRELAAKALFPFLDAVPVMRAYGGFRPYAPDHLPVIGTTPGCPACGTRPGTRVPGSAWPRPPAGCSRSCSPERGPHVDAEPFRVACPAVVGAGGAGMSFEIRVDGAPVAAWNPAGRWPAYHGPGQHLARHPPERSSARRVLRHRRLLRDCLVVVNGVPDVRACQRTVVPGDDIRTQHGAELPGAGES